MAVRSSPFPSPSATGLAQPRSIASEIARYYAEFLSTDFKSARLPKRTSQRKNSKGLLVGVDLGRYPKLASQAHQALSEQGSKQLSVDIRRGAYRASLPSMVRQVVEESIENIEADQIEKLVAAMLSKARQLITDDMDLELFRDVVMEKSAGLLRDSLVEPLLHHMSEHLKNTAQRPAEELLTFNHEITERLLAGVEEQCVDGLSTLVVNDDEAGLRNVLTEQLELSRVRETMKDFFEGFIANDLFVELSDMRRSQRMMENTEFFLYIGTIQIEGHTYPMAFQRLEIAEQQGALALKADTQLYINKQAIDFAVGHACRENGTPPGPSVVQKRIHYLSADMPAFEVLQPILDALALACGIRADIDLADAATARTIRSSRVAISSQTSIALADKPDESILNDYESLLSETQSDARPMAFFERLVGDFLKVNPTSVHAQVEQSWEETAMPERLVFESPLPLAEEQRKILQAVSLPDTRYVAVEGPPGTGKSHTITAIAFDAIIAGKSLLILSDKQEALDVVEDKLNEALRKVRHKEDFQNPILRLGRASGNYNRLMKKSSIEALEISRRMARQHEGQLHTERERELERLKSGLAKSAEVLSNIEMSAISEVHALERSLFEDHPHLRDIEGEQTASLLRDFHLTSSYLNEHRDRLLALLPYASDGLGLLERLRRIKELLARQSELRAMALQLMPRLRSEQIPVLRAAIADIDEARGLFGYLFSGKALRRISRELEEKLGLVIEKPQRQRQTLADLARTAEALREALAQQEGGEGNFPLAYDLLRNGCPPPASMEVLAAAERLQAAAEEGHALLPVSDGASLMQALLAPDTPSLEPVRRYAYVHERMEALRGQFANLPEIDYLGAKTRLEGLYTQELAGVIDERLISFYHHRRADAKTLGDVIRARGRFPSDKFALLKEAFPCMIAGLREYAEYVPLEEGLFDLVIIDEASQVSIAQAMPAILRARKMVVLGDRKQFGNVKTANASKALNQAYMEELRQTFTEVHDRVDDYTRQRLERFNIRSSVMDFFDLSANYTIQLRKHFRSYPEMIGFSSRYFYDGSLQTMKIRGKPLSEVIQFDAIEHDGLLDLSRNTNDLEIEHIFARLEELLEDETPYSAGIITPHTEQVSLINRKLDAHPRQAEFLDRLRLKVMNFDSCQGEERDVIFYSLVATREKDRLSYVFPGGLDTASADIEDNLRLQRLNVGFSRARERIVIVHSKPLGEFKSAIKTALFHYRNVLDQAARMPGPEEVDPHSPMELKVLGWLSQVPVIQQLGDRVEVHAQFPMGEYLKSLDPAYQHPAYRVDFLIRVRDGQSAQHLVVEYDGFEYHFQTDKRSVIDEGNWRHYLTDRDVERERVLESFGVKMIRLNRFVLNDRPVETLDRLLRERLQAITEPKAEHSLLEKTKQQTSVAEQGLKEGTHKHCKKCDRVKPLAAFTSTTAKSGYGRFCIACRA